MYSVKKRNEANCSIDHMNWSRESMQAMKQSHPHVNLTADTYTHSYGVRMVNEENALAHARIIY